MLGISTNQNINCATNGFASSNLDDDMDPLFHNDWLHEHNLDILFDLFEEELEGKDLDSHDADSSAIFGSSPLSSYPFGTPPLLASTLDLYDLLYFDNQQTSTPPQPQQQQQLHHHVSYHNHHLHRHLHHNNSNSSNPNNNSKRDFDLVGTICGNKGRTHKSSSSSNHDSNDSNRSPHSITNAMKIKRRSKKGQSEGVSLLAKPLNNTSPSSNKGISSCSNSSNRASDNNNLHLASGSKISSNIKNLSDKASSIKLSSSKKSVITSCPSYAGRVIDTNYSRKNLSSNKYLHHYHHHVHYITGCAVIREHAYAVR